VAVHPLANNVGSNHTAVRNKNCRTGFHFDHIGIYVQCSAHFANDLTIHHRNKGVINKYIDAIAITAMRWPQEATLAWRPFPI
jgi:hypothetical protein